MGGNSCEFVVGRLLEVRFAPGPRRLVDVPQMIDLVAARVAHLDPGVRFAVVADWRAVQIMSPEMAARALQMLAGVNQRVTRSALLTQPANATMNMQILRLIQEAENVHRRPFASPHSLYRWLSEVLTEPESRRLTEFLGITAE